MASKGKGSSIDVVVCGLTSSSFQSLSGQGAGKSYLCNRFIRPKFDELKEHTSVLNNSDFGSNIINNTHFLYWGEKVVALEDGQEVRIKLVEHTEFVDDASLKPFSYAKPYHKRCTQLKLQSGGKIMYINNDQLALPEEYTTVDKFPDKFNVDGFIVCADVSTNYDDPSNPQKEFFIRLFNSVQQSRRHCVVAMTKFEHAIDSSVACVNEIVSKSKKQIPIVEVSALRGVNVDMCFLVLCHLVDPKTPKTKIVPFVDAKSHLDDRIRKIETAFQQEVLDKSVTDFSLPVHQVCKQLDNSVDYLLLCELKGIDRVHKLIRGQLSYLKKLRIESKFAYYLDLLPCILQVIIPMLSLSDDVESCCRAVHSSKKFLQYMVDVSDWRNDTELLKSNTDIVPYGVLEEECGREILEQHINKVLKSTRENFAIERIRDSLRNSKGLLPGTNQQLLWKELGVVKAAAIAPSDQLTKLYMEHMVELEKLCVTDLDELLLERIALVADATEGSQKTLDMIDQELRNCDRYKRFDCRSDVRKAHVLKHIGSVQMGEEWSHSHCHAVEALEKLKEEGQVSKEHLDPSAGNQHPSEGFQWSIYSEDEYFNLCLIARTLNNALTLRSDFMNHLTGNCLFESEGVMYRLEIGLFHSEDGPITTMTNQDSIPNGAVAVVNSMECLDWLEDLVNRLWIPSLEASLSQPSYRGMPLVILALDKTASADPGENGEYTALHKRAREISNSVQSICLTERPTEQPKRLVVSTIIHQLLTSLIDTVTPTRNFFSEESPKQDNIGLNIAVCSLCGDSYPALSLLSPWLRHQAVYCGHGNQTLFLKCNVDTHLRTCTLTFHSALNVKEVLSFTRLGFILVYSTSRPASLAVVRFLMSRLPNIPKMVVAMVSEKSHDNSMIEEGRLLAKKWSAPFIDSSEGEWAVGSTSDFFSRCWFVRFSSWNNQEMPDNVREKLREKRRARALPTRPTFDRDSPMPLPPVPPAEVSVTKERLSLPSLLNTDTGDEEDPYATPPFLSKSIPHSPLWPKHLQATPISPPPPGSAPVDSAIYSDPIAPKIGIMQKKAATLERNKKMSASSDQFLFPISPPADDPDRVFSASLGSPFEGEYASVSDALDGARRPLSMMGTLERQRKGLKSPSMSPPPLPFSPTDSHVRTPNGSVENYPTDLYATVDTSSRINRVHAKPGYDRLEGSPVPPRKKASYDHLPPAVPIRTDSLSNMESSAAVARGNLNKKPLSMAPPLDDLYATVDKQHKAPPKTPQPDLYATVDKQRKASPEAPQPDDQYATVDKQTKTKRQPQQPAVDSNPEALYSVVQKRLPQVKPKPPRRPATPDGSVYSLPSTGARGKRTPPLARENMKTPPPIAPKPINKRSPTPTAGHRLRTPTPVLPQLRSDSLDSDVHSTRHSSMDRTSSGCPVVPPRQKVDVRVSTLPKNYRLNTKPLDDSHDVTPTVEDEDDTPALPKRIYSPLELELDDEPPPLPMRAYNWSDMEDNDDDLFQSDDDLDDPLWTVSDQQKLYASITLATQRSCSVSGVESIYNMVNRMVMIEEHEDKQSTVTRQTMSVEEESAYDTLENVMQTIRGERFTPYSSSVPQLTSVNNKELPQAHGLPVHVREETKAKQAASQQGLKATTLTTTDMKNLQKTQKLLKKLDRKAQREAQRRRAQEARKQKRAEEDKRKREGKKKEKKGKKQPERSRYFGSPLEKVAESDGVPVFVRKSVEFVERTGLKVEGLYRVPGKKENCLLLQDKFEEDATLDLSSLDMYESAVCSTLKAFFKLLPDPLIPNNIAVQLLTIHSLDTADSQKTRLHELLSALPRPNLKTLKAMMEHLHRVQELHEFNKMTPSNLSIVFWPTLIRPPLMDLADPSKQLGWQLLMTKVIERPDCIPDVD